MKTALILLLLYSGSLLGSNYGDLSCEFSDGEKEGGEFYVDDELYPGVDDITYGYTHHGHFFGFDGRLDFFLFSAGHTTNLHAVNGDPACWSGDFSFYDSSNKEWKNDIRYTVTVTNISEPENKQIYFRSSAFSAVSKPPLCITPNRKGELVVCKLTENKFMPSGFMSPDLDDDIQRVLIQHGILDSEN